MREGGGTTDQDSPRIPFPRQGDDVLEDLKQALDGCDDGL